jgi:uncharacterized cupin superfamily protein
MKSTMISMPIDPRKLEAHASSGYPEHFAKQVLPREKRALGDAAGLTKIGINLTTLWPGAASSMRHWHTHEDELIYLLEGELVLVTDSGERPFLAGQCAGFPQAIATAINWSIAARNPRSISRSATATRRTSRSIRTWTWSGTRRAPRARIHTRTGASTDYRAARFRSFTEPGRHGHDSLGRYFLTFLRSSTQSSAATMISTKSQKIGFFV